MPCVVLCSKANCNSFNQLRDYWKSMLAKEGDLLRTNVIEGLSKTTLDVIGLAGQSLRVIV